MNRLAQFAGNVPPKEIHLWWNRENESWEIWFGEEPPQFADGEFTPFTEKLFRYRAIT